MNAMRQFGTGSFSRNGREWSLLAACLLAIVIFSVASPHYATLGNAATVLRNSVELLLIGLGMTLLLAMGGIDVSIGVVMGLSAIAVGRALGGPKLAPAISPGKTWSGAIGGAAGGVIAAVVLAAAAGTGHFTVLALIAFALSVVAQMGDLFESWVKRRHGRKDSGALIPGHGGVMDRVDGLVAAALALYVIGCISAGADHPAQGLFPG